MPDKWLNSFFHRPNAMLYTGWAVVLLGLFWKARYQAFLRPEFGIFIALGVMVFVGLALVEMRRDQEPATFQSLARLGILFVPLLFLTRAQSFTLDTYALEKRSTISWQNGNMQASSISAKITNSPTSLRRDYLSKSEEYRKSAEAREKPRLMVATPTPMPEEWREEREAEIARAKSESGVPEEATLAMLSLAPDAFIKHKVSVVGMVQHNSKVAEYLGADSFVLFRFMVVCCAADAMPVAAAVQLAEPQTVEKDGWVKVEGVFEVQSTPHGPLPVIRKAKVEIIAKPEKIYLY